MKRKRTRTTRVQRIAYLAVIFVLFPLVIWTGLAMSPAFDSAFPWRSTCWAAGNPRARCISSSPDFSCSFCGARYDGLSGRIQEPHAGMITGRADDGTTGARMSKISRRKLITTGLAATAGVGRAWPWPIAWRGATG
jgi:hypothetical protein